MQVQVRLREGRQTVFLVPRSKLPHPSPPKSRTYRRLNRFTRTTTTLLSALYLHHPFLVRIHSHIRLTPTRPSIIRRRHQILRCRAMVSVLSLPVADTRSLLWLQVLEIAEHQCSSKASLDMHHMDFLSILLRASHRTLTCSSKSRSRIIQLSFLNSSMRHRSDNGRTVVKKVNLMLCDCRPCCRLRQRGQDHLRRTRVSHWLGIEP